MISYRHNKMSYVKKQILRDIVPIRANFQRIDLVLPVVFLDILAKELLGAEYNPE